MQNKVKINENNEMEKYNLTPKNTQKIFIKRAWKNVNCPQRPFPKQHKASSWLYFETWFFCLR